MMVTKFKTADEPAWTEFTDKKSSKSSKAANAESKTWKGEEEGDSIYGKVEEFKEITRKSDGTTAHVLNLYNENLNEWYTVWTKGMLLRLIQSAGVEPGQVIKIVFEGFKPMKTMPDRNYRSYKLFVAEA